MAQLGTKIKVQKFASISAITYNIQCRLYVSTIMKQLQLINLQVVLELGWCCN